MMRRSSKVRSARDGKPAEIAPPVAAGAGEGFDSPPSPVVHERHDLRVFQAMRRILRAIDLHSHKLSARFQITGPQLVCLLSVDAHQPVTPRAIARDVHLSASTVIGILDRLEAKGFVRRERGLADRRLVLVWLTDAGRMFVRNAPSPMHSMLTDAFNDLPESEQATIAGSLERIVEMMEGHQDRTQQSASAETPQSSAAQ